jgi:hypothetical protein
MLIRAWLFLGLIVAILSLAGFFDVLTQAGWHSGDPTGAHTRFHHAYQQATTMTFLGVIFGQTGTASAVRTRRASLRSVGCSATATCCGRSQASSRSPPCSCSPHRVKRYSAPPSHPHATCCCSSRPSSEAPTNSASG